MKLSFHSTDSAPSRSDALVCFAFQGEAPMLPKGVKLRSSFLESLHGEFREVKGTDAAEGQFERVIVVGLGKAGDADSERIRRVAALGVQRADAAGCASATLWFAAPVGNALGSARRAGQAAAEGAALGLYRFVEHKSKPKASKLKHVHLCGAGRDFEDGVERGRSLAAANAFARDLQNQPGNCMTPRGLAAAAQKLARRSARISCKVLDEKAMAKLGMGAILGVSAGSEEPAQLIHLVYKPTKRARGRVALVGKGLTFDAGGISIKPAGKMWDMKYDMSGGAAVLGVFHALAELDVPFEVHGIVPASENLPDGRAVKPGDLVKAMNGTTIEVLNTDAEGRLILCDALCYVQDKVKPYVVIDLATLTGAVVIALGHEYTGLFTNRDALRDQLLAAGNETGEKCWPLPVDQLHRDALKGEVADLRNIALGDPGAGSSIGAAFLSHFIGETPWVHLDIAGVAWGSANRDWVGGSMGSGVGVRLLMRFLETHTGI
ncbi:MAG: leucyl aminopeptidase [Planctomycetota bacterium]|nr:leucyl aminopeptidase [Planctomycetota bacterium]